MKPLAIDLFAGLGGWSDGLLAEDYQVIGFDIEQHVYGEHRYPGQLVIQDVLTLHGSQFKSAAIIVASPPCQSYSYMAMPWSLGKAKAAAICADTTGAEMEKLNRLFNACFRIQREACEAAGRHVPMIVENVRGAIPWVGRSRWNFGSFHLWGDVPALMPITAPRTIMKKGIAHRGDGVTNFHGSKVPGFRFDGFGKSFQSASVEFTGVKAPGMNWSDQTKRGQDFTAIAGKHAMEASGLKGIPHRTSGHWTNAAEHFDDGRKQPGIGGKRANGNGNSWFQDGAAALGSKSSGRKMASAMIAKIPLPLSRFIARTFHPRNNPDM